MKWLIPVIGAIALAGCQSVGSLTPEQDAQLMCIISGGVVAATSPSTNGAAVLASRFGNAQVVACNTLTQAGAVIATKK